MITASDNRDSKVGFQTPVIDPELPQSSQRIQSVSHD